MFHVFAVYLYDSKLDNRSYTDGRVQNVSELVSIFLFIYLIGCLTPPLAAFINGSDATHPNLHCQSIRT